MPPGPRREYNALELVMASTADWLQVCLLIAYWAVVASLPVLSLTRYETACNAGETLRQAQTGMLSILPLASPM